MRTILHDLDQKALSKFKLGSNDIIINANECQKPCIGCFSCWIKTPTKCIINDKFSNMTENLKKSTDFIIISKNRYGCYSQSVKTVLERCIGYVLPYFTERNNAMHHVLRYPKKLTIVTYFYGDSDEEDKKVLTKLVKANSINLGAKHYKVFFKNSIKEVIKCIH